MARLMRVKRRIVAMTAVLAAATGIGLAAEQAGAAVTFADGTSAYTWAGTCNSYVHEISFGMMFEGRGSIWARAWIYDYGRRRYLEPAPQWQELRPASIEYLYPAVRGDLGVLVEFARWVGYWDHKYEWVQLTSGGEYGQGFYYCPMP
jgi:hypothetical protein